MSQPNAAGAVQDGWAKFKETDTSNGTDVYGVTNASFSNIGSETASASLFTTTDTTPASGQPVYSETDWRSMTTWKSETGSYTTSVPGSAAITPTVNNPGGYALFDEERDALDSLSISG